MAGYLRLVCLLALCVACGQREAPDPAPSEEATAPAAAPTAATPAVPPPAGPEQATTPVDEAQMAALLAELTQVVRKYGMEQQRAPKTLEDLVSAGYLTRVPEAPTGKRFAISQRLLVYLADE